MKEDIKRHLQQERQGHVLAICHNETQGGGAQGGGGGGNSRGHGGRSTAASMPSRASGSSGTAAPHKAAATAAATARSNGGGGGAASASSSQGRNTITMPSTTSAANAGSTASGRKRTTTSASAGPDAATAHRLQPRQEVEAQGAPVRDAEVVRLNMTRSGAPSPSRRTSALQGQPITEPSTGGPDENTAALSRKRSRRSVDTNVESISANEFGGGGTEGGQEGNPAGGNTPELLGPSATTAVGVVYGQVSDLFTVDTSRAEGVHIEAESLARVLSDCAGNLLSAVVTNTAAAAMAHQKKHGGVVWPLEYVNNESPPDDPILQHAQGSQPLAMRAACLMHTSQVELRPLLTAMFGNLVIVLTSDDAHAYRRSNKSSTAVIAALDTGEIISAEGWFGRGMAKRRTPGFKTNEAVVVEL